MSTKLWVVFAAVFGALVFLGYASVAAVSGAAWGAAEFLIVLVGLICAMGATVLAFGPPRRELGEPLPDPAV